MLGSLLQKTPEALRLYERAIGHLARQSAFLHMDGANDDRPQGVGLVSGLFDVPVDDVVVDYRNAKADILGTIGRRPAPESKQKD